MAFDSFEVDVRNEVEVRLNGSSLGFLPRGGDDEFQFHEFQIGIEDQAAGRNEIEFVQKINPNFVWGITDVVLTENHGSDLRLVRNVLESGEFGNKYNGATDADGVISADFVGTGDELYLTFDGYDVDTASEIEVFLNGGSLGFLGVGVNNGVREYQFVLSVGAQLIGDNTLEFVQSQNDTFRWGVTDIIVSDDPFAVI